MHLAVLYNDRHKHYCKCMTNVAHHVIEAYMIHRELQRIEAAKQAKAKALSDARVSYKPLVYPCVISSRHLLFTSSINHYARIIKEMPCAIYAEQFLKCIKIVPLSDTTRGITRIELYVLYRNYAFPKPIQDKSCIASARATLVQQLNMFKICIRRIVDRVFIGSSEANLFKASSQKGENLAGVGLKVQHPALCFNVSMTANTSRQVAAVLVAIGRRSTQAKIQQFLDGQHKFVPN